jgi:hypothetical protein
VRGLKLSKVINAKARAPLLLQSRVEVKAAKAPQAKLAELEKKVRALSEELEALRRQMKQPPRKE